MSSNIYSPNSNQAYPPAPPTLPGESAQPTVRVMRLYKPGFHLTATMPVMDPLNGEAVIPYKGNFGADHSLSSHILLPDSFGDIYLGEKFSAYVAVVNGFANFPFYQVTLSVRLQTNTAVLDLYDIRATAANVGQNVTTSVLNFNESSDIIVQHTLNELGTHTLRVSVSYTLTSPLYGSQGEVKTLRKFYRFNVLHPLAITSHFREIANLPMVQCQVTNATKSPIFIEEVSFVPSNKSGKFISLHQKHQKQLEFVDQTLNNDDIILLQPDESYGFAFQGIDYDGLLPRVLGYPLVKWCNSMGETSMCRGDETAIKSPYVPTSLIPQPIKFVLLSCPPSVTIYEEFEINIRLMNTTSYSWPLTLDCPNHRSSQSHISPNRTSLSTKSNSSNPNFNGSFSSATLHNGLHFTGTTFTNLGNLSSGEAIEVSITLFASDCGLFALPPIFAVHAYTKERHASGVLSNILVNPNPIETPEKQLLPQLIENPQLEIAQKPSVVDLLNIEDQ